MLAFHYGKDDNEYTRNTSLSYRMAPMCMGNFLNFSPFGTSWSVIYRINKKLTGYPAKSFINIFPFSIRRQKNEEGNSFGNMYFGSSASN